jgi:phosphatidylglycerophosphate synthase
VEIPGKLDIKQEKVSIETIQEVEGFRIKSYLPNLLSLFRIIISPLLFFLIIFEEFYIALELFSVGIVTDVLDGRLARTFNICSKLGCFFDVFGDFSLIISTVIALIFKEIYPLWVLILVIAMFMQFLLTFKNEEPIYDSVGKYYGSFLFCILGITFICIDSSLIIFILTCYAGFTIIAITSRISALYKIRNKGNLSNRN